MFFWILAIGIPLAGFFLYTRAKSSSSRPRSDGKYDPKTGLGRGAPGFQTNIKRIAVPPEIIARIRAGEEVSAEEITRAQEQMQKQQEREAQQAANGDGSAAGGKKKKKGSKGR